MTRIINGVEYPDNLSEEDLSGANLRSANLSGANLSDACLRGACLSGADLRGANLSGADLSGADLINASLRGADMRACLRGACLSSADLSSADLSGADLSGANLIDADLSGAILGGAKLSGADLRDAKGIPNLIASRLSICPEGDIIGYKKLNNYTICKLYIPATAKRSNATGRKCRAEYAVVVEGEGVSCRDKSFTYVIGATVRPTEQFCEDRWEECAPGIHFFITREEAEAF